MIRVDRIPKIPPTNPTLGFTQATDLDVAAGRGRDAPSCDGEARRYAQLRAQARVGRTDVQVGAEAQGEGEVMTQPHSGQAAAASAASASSS